MNKRIFIFINKNNLRIKSYYIFKLRMINEIKDKQINTLKKKLKLIIILIAGTFDSISNRNRI